jgi:hypothetical protein
MYTHEILWFLSWPVFIYLSYLLASAAIMRFENRNKETLE